MRMSADEYGAGVRGSGVGFRELKTYGIRESGIRELKTYGSRESGVGAGEETHGIRESGFGSRDSGFGIRGSGRKEGYKDYC